MSSPRCKQLILDAGPLLSLSPLRGIAETFVTVPQVLAELKDRRAKEHLERLGTHYGVKIQVMDPDPASLLAVIAKAKETGDYSVLSQPDICVLALTHTLQQKAKLAVAQKASQPPPPPTEDETKTEEPAEEPAEEPPSSESEEDDAEEDLEPLDMELHPLQNDENPKEEISEPNPPPSAPLFEDPTDSADDGEGEWITPDNVALHKSKVLEFLPSVEGKGKGKRKAEEEIDVGCMTADFAMQNVLLQMGLNLVSVDGKRITKVKSWVLRCHACFKICKDSSKQFCPSCGNPSLLRTSVTISSPDASKDGAAPTMQIHLKPNYQYKTRGTKYSIPAPKPGSAKTGPGEGLILREDQLEYMRAKKRVDTKRERDEAKLVRGIISRGAEGDIAAIGGGWMDPDWVPEMLVAGTGGKGRSQGGGKNGGGELPAIGYGRRNPNERRRHK